MDSMHLKCSGDSLKGEGLGVPELHSSCAELDFTAGSKFLNTT